MPPEESRHRTALLSNPGCCRTCQHSSRFGVRDCAPVMQTAHSVRLGRAMLTMLRHPLTLLTDWNWKAALFSAILRGLMFFLINLRAGRASAGKAMLVEVVYAAVAAGLAGAVTQRLRFALPRFATAAVMWLILPACMLAAQAAVHHAMGTPRLRASLIASFLFAAFATGFNWFAMARGVFVTGQGRPFLRDLLLVPQLLVQFLASFAGWSSLRREDET